MNPREEFAEALRSVGCVVAEEHPLMDGQKHRIGVVDDKQGEQAGFYVGHLDGHPAGYIKNNRTGVDMKWKSKGYALDPEQKAALAAEAAEKLQARAAEQDRLHEKVAQRVAARIPICPGSEPGRRRPGQRQPCQFAGKIRLPLLGACPAAVWSHP